MDILKPKFYINRELSALEFNCRVLGQAADITIPLLERLKFLCIFSANLDEFFEIRVAGLKQLVAYKNVTPGIDGLTPAETLKKISTTAHTLVVLQNQILQKELLPALEKENIHFLSPKKWSVKQAIWIKHYFYEEILPIVSPIALDPAHPMPRLVNKSLNFVVSLKGKDAFGRDTHLAIVHAPRSLPRVTRLPEKISKKGKNFIFLSDIIEAYATELFPGMEVLGCYQFRLTRNSDLLLDEEIAEDLAGVLQNQLLARPFGMAVRLEIAAHCPPDIARFLLQKHDLIQDELYLITGPVNLSRLLSLYDTIDEPTLKFPPFTPKLPKVLKNTNLFSVIHEHDILLHHPYNAFNPVIEFIRQATLDPHVLAIKQTLYRTGPDSLIVRALLDAARAGKEVTAVIELRARFEEESNLELANRLQEAGALVVYGVMGFKTHGKMMLVVRREGKHLRRYCHLGTGNYHANTARIYTDYSLFTADELIGLDVQNVFQQLTGMGKAIKLKKLWQAPFTLVKYLIEHIENETNIAAQGKPARIIAKINALTDPKIIAVLYTASQAGVKIDLIVRGICCLRPGIPGISENIHVRSIVGRFLEHERVFYFLNDGNEKIYCSSADWMERNLYKRVELCFPIKQKKLAERIKKESLLAYLADNCQSWILMQDGSYQRMQPGKQIPYSAQRALMKQT
jgi:polyphosphate kinase